MNENEQILTSILNCPRVDLFAKPSTLTLSQQDQYETIKQRHLKGEPLQYLLGYCEFMGLSLRVDPRVLIPRPETELLVEYAIKKFKGESSLNILDVGTGSGNIAIAFAKFMDCSVMAMDISKDALALAFENAKENSVQEKIQFHHDNMTNFFYDKNYWNRFDVIISNPPYVRSQDIENLPKDVQKEPRLALDGGEDGLECYRVLVSCAHRFLKEDGYLFLEIGDDQRRGIEQILETSPYYEDIEFIQDYNGRDRIVSLKTIIPSPKRSEWGGTKGGG